MNWKSLLLRIVISLAILVGLLVYVSPQRVLATMQEADWRWLAGAAVLMPVFLFCRMSKWFLLVRQVEPDVNLRELASGYLWGMAIGKLTPGNIGEVARAWAVGNPVSQVGLFVLEKMVEVGCLFALCLLGMTKLGLAPFVAVILAVLTIFAIPAGLRLAEKLASVGLPRFILKAIADKLEGIRWALANLRIYECITLSLLCYIIFIVQAYLIMRSLGYPSNPGAILLFPIVLSSNLLPITIGGFGLREGAAVLILRAEAVPEAIAASGFFLVSVVDLLIPALLGAVIHFVKGKKVHTIASSEDSSERREENGETVQWEDFWERRNKKVLGRLISSVRSYIVTPSMARFVLENTEGGTLIEAGCGTGEVTALVAKKRNDRIILVDISSQSLMLAKHNIEGMGLTAELIKCDIVHLGDHIERIPDATTFNIGVIEHFSDCSAILREMAEVSGRSAMAIVPKSSIFWKFFITLSFRLGLVSPDFFIVLYDEDKLRRVTEDARLEVLAILEKRILGFIPYLAVCFRRLQNSLGTPSTAQE